MSAKVMRHIDDIFHSRVETVYSNADAIERHIKIADLVIGGVLIPGAAAPKLVRREHLGMMHKGSVLVDVAIDQGGCFETSKATTHEEPTYIVDGIVHYCVANMPGAVPRTSTFALNNATLPFTLALADKGAKKAMLDDPHLLAGLNVHRGKVSGISSAKIRMPRMPKLARAPKPRIAMRRSWAKLYLFWKNRPGIVARASSRPNCWRAS